jgi:hypothetical protein
MKTVLSYRYVGHFFGLETQNDNALKSLLGGWVGGFAAHPSIVSPLNFS